MPARHLSSSAATMSTLSAGILRRAPRGGESVTGKRAGARLERAIRVGFEL